jgi:hypothetical protein
MSAALCTELCIFAAYWSDGRAARLSSAKAATAVRIRFGPPKKSTPNERKFVWGFFYDTKFEAKFRSFLEKTPTGSRP